MYEGNKGEIRKIVFVLIFLNLFLFLIKWIPSLFFNSISVEADAFNSLADFGYSILFWLGFELVLKPKDDSHPHGHERFEPFISLFVAGAIVFTGFLVLKRAILSLFNPIYSFTPFFVIVLVLSGVSKYWLSSFLEKNAAEFKSTALESSSSDAKADVLASTAALIGVLCAWQGLELIDSLAGIIVSFWIFKTGYSIAKKNLEFLTGGSAPEEVIKKIKNILRGEDEVISFHDLEAHYVGPTIHVSLSVHLSEELDFEKVHEIEDKLSEKINNIDEVEEVYLHLEPRESDIS